ncbi:protein ROLLING AND ERECT LEAF 2-like isoform X2 [Brassica napus]|uniref:protein ROLLING AND ERECT LEAF 2-like isoform X2 n=1 Tax=Brassica napus TaxID=3708 RepID=UPI002078F20D|nr:protein ROLLING AND ERECT LEAF 2-like isoform X2 [Brassica napus]
MGCTTSKLDDLPAVALCLDRCGFLQTAIQQRYALADSHLSYTQSLQVVAQSLHTFIDHHHRFAGEDSHHPPEEDDDDSPKRADSGSGHIEFDSDSDEIDSLHHSSPLHEDPSFTRYSNPDPPSSSYLHMNYMKNSSMPPSVVYEQRPSSPQRVYLGESSASNYDNPYPSYGPSKPPPPPPPRTEGWDFLNLFDYAPYTLTQDDSREVREEEGIPDLEDDFHREVVKEVHGKQKLVAGKAPVPAVDDKEEPPGGGGGQASRFQTRPSLAVEKEDKEEYEVHVVEKKVVKSGGEEAPRGGGVRRGVPEVAKEIEAQFFRAAESASEIAVLLEVGKQHPNARKHGAAASSKMIQEVTPSPSVVSSSQPSTSKKAKASSSAAAAAPTYADIEAELALRSRNLSSTLHKLHLWEKKLYEEVKAEEKLRLLHERKLRKLKRMDERGTDAPKVDSTRRFVRSLSTKIRIAIQVVDKISVTINKIRDEELWLQLNQLIQGLSRMWKSMLDCHRSQCKAIKEARGLGSIRASKKLPDDHLEATRVLGHDLINWILRFSGWVSVQKGFVRGLNSWLMKCLIYEPEETPDGIVPFSPGRLGAPMIFVICNQWEQALDRISEKEVVEAMRRFTASVLHLWEQDRLETMERMIGHGGEEQRIQKEIQEMESKMVLVGSGGDRSDTSNESLQGSLRRIFEAMERFSAESVRAYDDLLERAAEKENSSQESEED